MGSESSESHERSTTPPHPTPGPWHYDAWRGEVRTSVEFIVAETVAISNGDFIAAAPDLLAALKALLSYDNEKHRNQAKAAIAKAEGREQ